MTKKLFEQDVDLRVFHARVLSCVPHDKEWDVVLDQTAFFPEGGGQSADKGFLNSIPVRDVHQQGEEIHHYIAEPLEVGAEAEGQVDDGHRLDMMQQHSGEHILSGIICSTFGYSNVGFHIGEQEVRVDFSGPMTDEELQYMEQKANEAIWRDVPIQIWIPSKEELAKLEYRSKKELTGDVRIVRIPGCDTCACCGTHVHTTGQVGQIKIIDAIHYKGGMRLWICCGKRALLYDNALQEQARQVSRLLSAKPLEISGFVERTAAEREEYRLRCEALAEKLFALEARAVQQDTVRVMFTDVLEPTKLRRAAGDLAADAHLAAVFLAREEGWDYAICSNEMDVRPLNQLLRERFGGKGGGPKDMVQGKLERSEPEAIRQLILEATK